jgi:class 3 adenylate cyclase/tetratricopeptide (TPR) repeat protein
MTTIREWLEGLGLSRFAGAFEEHEIDFDALPHLTEHLLERMGLPIGPRVKLLAAISVLESSPDAAIRKSGDAPAAVAAPGEQQQAERRQITVMFCDMVGSTQLAKRLDPEDLRALMRAYQQACGAVVERYEGHVAQILGDGIMAYFGWPRAHEDDPERAARAGLEVVAAVDAIEGPEPLSVRVGISTGIVVVGESEGGEASESSLAVGETPNVAARLQAIAEPDTVVVGPNTGRLISGRFDVEDMGPQSLKGLAEPIAAFRVMRARDESSRFQAAHASALTPLVGRRAELALLQERWLDAKGGEGQVVFVSGVPGIGKSRIVHELETSLAAEPNVSLKLQCSPHHGQSALFPVIQLIARAAGIGAEDPDAAKLDKLESLLSQATRQVDKAAPLIAEMLSIPVEPRYAPLALSAQQIKDQTLVVLVELLLGLSAKEPVFCLVEDAQWIDPSTQELLDMVMGRVEKARILLVVSHRPEYQPHSGVHGNVSALTISRLRRSDVAEMARLALREQAVPTAVMERIVDESDAVPLFIEELARGAVESGAIDGPGGRVRFAEPSATWSVPDSLRDSLMARLDRAPQGRSVAQMAAVVGREFPYEMLQRISPLSKSELDFTLGALEENEIIQQIERRPTARYLFKHALVRDSAYESLLKSSRRQIHGKVAEVMEEISPEVVTSQPELLAYHYSRAGNAEFAVRYWVHGGKRAHSRWANLEAIAQFRHALEFLQFLPETAERNATELDIQLSHGLCDIAIHGYASNETRKPFERACDLSAQLGDSSKEMQSLFGLWGHYWMQARHDRAIELSELLLAKAEPLGDPVPLIVGHRSLGSTLFTKGDFVQARKHLEKAIALSKAVRVEELSSSYAVDPRVASRLMLGWELWILGYPDQALASVTLALAEATEHAHPYGIAFAHYVTAAVHLLRREAGDSLRHADESLALSREHRINLFALYSRFGRGCALAELGQATEAIAEIQEGIEEARRSSLGYMRGFMLGWLATVQAETGDAEAALSTIDAALKDVDDVSGHAWEAELHRLHGNILAVVHPEAPHHPEASYRKAIAVAHRQAARSLELRATTSLARLLRAGGRRDEARDHLASIHDWFTEGFDTADLREAKALLDDLQ